MAISILFFVRKRSRANSFELFAKAFRRFRPRGNSFDGPIFFQILADSAAIRLVQKSSKSEPSSRFFSHLKFQNKNCLASGLCTSPRQVQNRNGHMNTVFIGNLDRWLQTQCCLFGVSTLLTLFIARVMPEHQHNKQTTTTPLQETKTNKKQKKRNATLPVPDFPYSLS